MLTIQNEESEIQKRHEIALELSLNSERLMENGSLWFTDCACGCEGKIVWYLDEANQVWIFEGQ